MTKRSTPFSPEVRARTVADLCDTLKQAFERFTPVECRNYLMAAGYDAFDPT